MTLRLAFVALLLLTACTTQTSPTTAPLPTTTPTPSASATPSPSPSPSPSPTPSASPTPATTASPSPSLEPTLSPCCTSLPTPTAAPLTPGPTTAEGVLSLAAVRYLLLDQLGPLHYCDPDEYPVSVGGEQENAIAQFSTIQDDTETFLAIVERIGIDLQTVFSNADKLAIYREWKLLNSVVVQPLANGTYQFDVTTEGDAASGAASYLQGTVDAVTGAIAIVSQEQVFGVACPI